MATWIQLLQLNHCLYNVYPMLKNWSPPSAAFMRQWTGSSLVQVMACRLFGAKPLPETMLTYCQLDSREPFQWILKRNSIIFIQENAIQKRPLPQCRPFCPGGRWVKRIVLLYFSSDSETYTLHLVHLSLRNEISAFYSFKKLHM